MQNFVQPGHTVTKTAPRALLGGEGFVVGRFFGIASKGVASGAKVEAKTSGVFDLPKLTGDTFAEGAEVFWDNTAFGCRPTGTGRFKIGTAVDAVGTGVLAVRVLLDGISVTPVP